MSFEHTRRALAAMNLAARARMLLLTSVAFAAWLAWLFLGHVSVYVKSTEGRLEVVPAPMPINAPVVGVVASCSLALGARVTAGTSLMRLDARTFGYQADEARATLKADEAALAALRGQLEVEVAARDSMVRVVATTHRAGEVRVAASQEVSRLKQQENDVMTKLSNAELASKMDSLKSISETEAQRMQVRVSSVQAALDESTAKMTLQDRVIRVANLSTQIVDAESSVEVERAKLRSLEYEIDRRDVRALADGTITDTIACAPGMTVTSETRLGTLLPQGEVRVVAYFEPREVVGRVHRDQKAIIRVANFPWTQFGTLEGKVQEVGSEPHDGTVRVELGVTSLNSDIPAIHGLVATAEVLTERLSPARLLLRMAGQQFETTHAPAPAPVQALVSRK